jgi:superfamily II DNA or RNA helicase
MIVPQTPITNLFDINSLDSSPTLDDKDSALYDFDSDDNEELPLFYLDSNYKLDKYMLMNNLSGQNFIISYLHPESPYDSLLVCFKVGFGKTYAAALLSHIYLSKGFSVLYTSNGLNSISNFNKEYKKVISDHRFSDILEKIDSYTFSKLYNMKTLPNYGLIVIDEAHNLRENATRYRDIKNKLLKMTYSKILITTATPMIDEDKELEAIKNLANSNIATIFSSDTNFTKININYQGVKINSNILYLSKMKGIQRKEYMKEYYSNEDVMFTNTRQASISSSSKYNPDIPLDEQSSKIAKLIESLDPKKPTVVFCFFISRGINFLAQVLDYLGYKKWNPLINKVNQKTYAVIDGSTKQSGDIINAFNNVVNRDGMLINILIGSSVLNESITLYRVRELHLLSPFWNMGHVNQAIGRVIRINSHQGLDMNSMNINVYLHAAYYKEENNKYIGKDIDMWNICTEKQLKIDNKMNEEIEKSMEFHKNTVTEFIYPKTQDLVIQINNVIWDLRECFETNTHKISWCQVDREKAIGYDLERQVKIIGTLADYVKILTPLPKGYTIWRSAVDNKLRISNLDSKDKRKRKRGKLISNLNNNDIQLISEDLNCDPTIEVIVDILKSENRYFDKQIVIDENALQQDH